MSARDDVLGRVRSALGSGPREIVAITRDYRSTGDTAGSPDLIDLLEERLVDYKATVRRTTDAGIGAAVAAILRARFDRPARVVVPAALDPTWVAGADVVVDDGILPASELDSRDAVVTACALAIAETGTIVLDASPDQGRRAISLVPDLHICVVRADQVVDDVPDALRRLEPKRPLTFISGGSATSDIELNRVEGVHGPRTLEVVIVSD